MEIKYECLPCLSRQLVTLAVKVTDDKKMQENIIQFGFTLLSKDAFKLNAPKLTAMIYEYAKSISGVVDPFMAEKKVFNHIAEDLVKSLSLHEMIKDHTSPFEAAVRLSVAGNIIDFSVGDDLDEKGVVLSIESSLTSDFYGNNFEELHEEVKEAKKIIILGDNAGEIVFDKLLLDHMALEKVTYVVKGGPIVNDATMADAKAIGLLELVKVIDTGVAMQGIDLENSSTAFLELMNEADVVISKGQANYETMNHLKEPNIYFLLRAKCQAVADQIGCEKGAFVIKKNATR